jgi:hypothetical protein
MKAGKCLCITLLPIAGCNIGIKQKRFEIGIVYMWRWMKQYEYSKEDDPNDFFLRPRGCS